MSKNNTNAAKLASKMNVSGNAAEKSKWDPKKKALVPVSKKPKVYPHTQRVQLIGAKTASQIIPATEGAKKVTNGKGYYVSKVDTVVTSLTPFAHANDRVMVEVLSDLVDAYAAHGEAIFRYINVGYKVINKSRK